jgi:hypothetical protein
MTTSTHYPRGTCAASRACAALCALTVPAGDAAANFVEKDWTSVSHSHRASFCCNGTLAAARRRLTLGRVPGRGLHSFTSQVNLCAFYGIGGAHRGCVARVKGVFRVFFVCQTRLKLS